MIDDLARPHRAVEVERSLPARDVTAMVNHLIRVRGETEDSRGDHGGEFIVEVVEEGWPPRARALYVAPGGPREKARG